MRYEVTTGLTATHEGRNLEDLIGALSTMEPVAPKADEIGEHFREVVDVAAQSANAGAAVLYLYDQGKLRPVARFGGGLAADLCDPDASASACTLLQHVLDAQAIVNIPDIRDVPQQAPYARHIATACGARGIAMSILAMPVRAEAERTLGVLEILDGRDDNGNVATFPARLVPLLAALADQVGTTVVNARLKAKLRDAQYETVLRLSTAAEFRDTDTAAHVYRMSHYSTTIARHVGLSEEEVESTRLASPMHDLGKLGIPDQILRKQGPLTEDEWGIMRLHPKIGADILAHSDSPLLQTSERIALSHHEKVDGSGYPYGARGDDIPLVGRIVALGDAFDAITSKRCYKDALPLEAALETVRKDSGIHFDPDCVRALESGFAEIVDVHAAFASAT
jgi:HD-GYP domain-containing protein (c-di-GMP phosphodiesterase class II)